MNGKKFALFLMPLLLVSIQLRPPILAPIDQPAQAPLASNVAANGTVGIWRRPPGALALAAASSFVTARSFPAPVIIPAAGPARGEEELAKKSGCLDCHAIDKKLIGPAFHDIAVKYKDAPGARAALIEKVKNGGKGNWTEITKGVPMPPHRRLSDPEIERLVDWVLGL